MRDGAECVRLNRIAGNNDINLLAKHCSTSFANPTDIAPHFPGNICPDWMDCTYDHRIRWR